MQLSNKPDKLVLPFANGGSKNTIPTDSQIGIVAGKASLIDGFPPLTRTPLSAGGVPPSGLDMNGILFEMSALSRWFAAGGAFAYDSTFANDTNVGGYPKGARLLSADGLSYWLNTVENNTSDPDAGGAGWVSDSNAGMTSVAMASANVTLTAAQAAKPTIVITGVLTADLNLIFPGWLRSWVVVNKTAGNYRITAKTAVGSGVILTPDTSQIVYGDGTNIDSGPAGRRIRLSDPTFPANFKQQQRSFFRADIVAPNGEGTNGFQAISINGTPINNTFINFLATATPDVVTMSGWALRGSGGTNPLVVSNFGAWFENNTNIVWVQEVDVNNEGATQSEGNHNGGVGVAINTGSTYSPNSAIDIRRYTGAGTGPGFLQGVVIAGVRNTALRIEAMAAATYPGMTPAAPGSIDVIQALVSNDANLRFRGSIGNANSGMRMEWGSGAAATDIIMERVGAGMLTVNSDINSQVAAAYLGVWSAVSTNNNPVGKLEFVGKNSAAAIKAYSTLISTIINNTAGSEDGMFQIWNRVSGTVTHVVDVQAGLIVGPTAGGGDKGIGTVNVLNAYYTNGVKVVGARDTGWGAASNGSKVAFNGSTATLAQTSAAVAAIIAALTTHGLIGA